jgi:uncharacterized glyoxalase superfamily protein PhnB
MASEHETAVDYWQTLVNAHEAKAMEFQEELAVWHKHFPEYSVTDGKLCYSGKEVPMSVTARLAEAERLLRWARDCLGHPDNIAVIDRYFAGATDSAVVCNPKEPK